MKNNKELFKNVCIMSKLIMLPLFIVSLTMLNLHSDIQTRDAHISALNNTIAIQENDIKIAESYMIREEEEKCRMIAQNDNYMVLLAKKSTIIQDQNVTIIELNKKLNKKNELEGVYVPEGDYEIATKVWNRLMEIGVNEYVASGIIGNLMAEVGGQTLDLSNWEFWSKGSYYGIAQWTEERKDRLISEFGSDIDAQIDFLLVEMYEYIPKDSSFWSLENEQDAAIYFAEQYEQCSQKYWYIRAQNARVALKYFCGY